MATATDIGKTAQDQILSAYAMAGNALIEGVRTWAEAIESVTPENFNAPAVPGMDNLPTPAEAVEAGFEFAQRILETQHQLATSLIEAVAPAVNKVEPKAAAKASAKS